MKQTYAIRSEAYNRIVEAREHKRLVRCKEDRAMIREKIFLIINLGPVSFSNIQTRTGLRDTLNPKIVVMFVFPKK